MSFNSRDSMNILLDKFKRQQDSLLEISFSPIILEKNEFITLYNGLKSNASNIQYKEIVSSISIQRERTSPVIHYFIKDIFFKHGKKIGLPVFTKKSTLYKSYKDVYNDSILKEYTMNVFNVQHTTFELKSNTINSIDIILSNQFQLKEYPDWVIYLDIVKSLNQQSDFHNLLKVYKNSLLKKYENFPDDVNIHEFDYIRVRAEFVGEQHILSKKNIYTVFKHISSSFQINASQHNQYQEMIFYIANIVYHKNPIMIQQFQRKSGFKRLVNNVIELNRSTYFSTISPNIDSFYVTDKIDGRRCLIMILSKGSSIHVYIIADNLYTVRQYTIENIDINEYSVTILDAEMIYSGSLKDSTVLDLNVLDLYVFDVLMFHNKNMTSSAFETRYLSFEKVNTILHSLNLGVVKDFVKLEKDTYKDQLRIFYENCKKNEKYEIDGLIFTPTSHLPIKTMRRGTKTIPINTNYSNMICYKWKPIDKLSIDFFIAEVPIDIRKKPEYHALDKEPKKNMYILCSGIDIRTFQQLKFQLCPYYKDIIPIKYHTLQYFPIQFSPDDHPYAYIYFSNTKDLHNKVGEFLYKKNNWELIRIRDDRDVEIERGEYYGNALRYSELIWQTIQYPLSFDQLLEDSNAAYFAKTSEDMYVNQRYFNSFVKSEMLRLVIHPMKHKTSSTEWLMDLACGKGQDLGRVVKIGFKNVVMFDKDMDAIYQLLERKYNLDINSTHRKGIHLKSKKESITAKIYVHQMDLSESYKKNIDKINQLSIPKGTMDVIICNFAIHYFMEKEDDISNLLLFMSHFLKPDGRFMFTCFDGHKLFDLLKDQTEYDWKENGILKYSIQKRYQSNILTDLSQKIGVILPFTNKEYYEEYLVNLSFLQSILEKLGFQKEISASFGSLLHKFKKSNPKVYEGLTSQDKDFVSLYSYNIYIKNKKIRTSEENIELLMEKV